MNVPPARPDAATHDGSDSPHENEGVRQRLLEIAEKLFADLGVENTPLQRIVQESGQRNRSALNYHFGTRRDLVSALLDMRMRHVNALRSKSLDAVEARGQAADAGIIVRAMYQPMLDVIRVEPWGRSYFQVLAQCMFNPALATYELISPAAISAMQRGYRMLERASPHVPPETIQSRLIWSADVVVHSIARWCREGVEVWDAAGPLEDMLDFIVSGMTAPVSIQGPRAGLQRGKGGHSGLGRWLEQA